MHCKLLPLSAILSFSNISQSFLPLHSRIPRSLSITTHSLNVASPSKVVQDDEPTPPRTMEELEEADPSIYDEMKYDENDHVPGQPWRRGMTMGAEDPIQSSWRMEAEEIIKEACSTIGAVVDDVTWGMGYCLITIADMKNVEGVIDGPEIDVDMGEWYDESPTGTGPDYFWKPKMSEEEMEEYASTHPETRIEDIDDPLDDPRARVDTHVLSAIAKVVLESLEDPDVEERLKITSRHEIMLASPGAPDILNTQKQFDAFRGFDVMVETRDPWRSNRTVKGKLVERNALDVIINQKGRLVTIPNNFIYRVKLPSGKKEKK